MIDATFKQFRQQTADDLSAAVLTLASILSDRQVAAVEQPLTVGQAAKRLNVSPRTVYDLCAAGRLKHHRIGVGKGALRINPDDLNAYEQGAEVEPPESAALRYLDRN